MFIVLKLIHWFHRFIHPTIKFIHVFGCWASPWQALTTQLLRCINWFLLTHQHHLHMLWLSLPKFFFSISWGDVSYPDMPWSGTLRKSMFPWLCWLWAGTRGILWEPSLGRAVLGGRPCLCGEEYVISDGWLWWALENWAAPFWCAEEGESGEKVKLSPEQPQNFFTAATAWSSK